MIWSPAVMLIERGRSSERIDVRSFTLKRFEMKI